MKLITWNINSVRLRLPLLSQLTTSENPDVVCLQEIKVHSDLFPSADIEALGYKHLHFRGMKGYKASSRKASMHTGDEDSKRKEHAGVKE